jgi:hypothetical protein
LCKKIENDKLTGKEADISTWNAIGLSSEFSKYNVKSHMKVRSFSL